MAARYSQARGARSDPRVPSRAQDLGGVGVPPAALRARPLRAGDGAAGRSRAVQRALSPCPSRSPGARGGAGGGPSGTPSREEARARLLFVPAPGKARGSARKGGRAGQWVWSLALDPRFPQPLKAALASVPRGHGGPVGLGTLNLRPDSLPRPCTAWLGRRRAAGLSHRDSEVRLPPPILGLPTSLLGGGGWARTAEVALIPLSTRPVVTTTVMITPSPSASRARARRCRPSSIKFRN